MRWWWTLGLAGLTACARPAGPEPVPVEAGALRPVEAFEGLRRAERSAALFGEMAKVFAHPRCANCHPVDDRPRQGMAQVVHDPPVWRGPDDHGVAGAPCSTCHQEANSEVSRVPGAENWHLAPASMGWIGQSPAAICAQLKDPTRNGGKTLEEVHHHLAADALVAWGWSPGHGREPAPGTQQQLGDLARAWIDSGAHCPEEAP